MVYNIGQGVIAPFSKRHARILILAIAGVFLLTQILFLIQPARAAAVSASSEAELLAALADGTKDTINITADFSTTDEISISRSVIINGNGHTLSPTFAFVSNASTNSVIEIIGTDSVTINNLTIDGTGGTSIHGVNIYESTNILLNDLTSTDNNKSGIVVNGSTVSVNNVTTDGNTWHGINVAQGVGVTDPADLTVTGVSLHGDLAPIYMDDTTQTVSLDDVDNQYLITEPVVQQNDRLYTPDPDRFVFTQGNNLKVNICHANNGIKGFTSNKVDLDGLNGHGDHEDDIIPPNPDLPDGLNWTRDNISIWQNDCRTVDNQGGDCEVGVSIFQIGDVEASQSDHPADEFTGSGAPGDFGTLHADPFVVGTNTDDEFPWNSNFSQGYGLDFEVDFNYSGPDLPEAKLIVAWSPGKSAVENKIVSLDGSQIDTYSHTGVSVAGWYNNSKVFQDETSFPLTSGDHTLRFQHTSGDGTFWDWVRLEVSQCPQQEIEPCIVSLVSNSDVVIEEYGDANAEELSFIHSAWTADIPGASWIWGDDPVIDPTVDTTQTFKAYFDWNGPVTSAWLDIASDNTYEAYVNGVLAGGDNDLNNFQLATQDGFDISPYIATGTNMLEIVVTNTAVDGSSARSNPAGVLFKLVVEGTDENCDEPEEEVQGQIAGLVYQDLEPNETKDVGDPVLPDRTVWLFTHNSPFTLAGIDTTDAGGNYLFENLDVPGYYYVCQDVEDGWFQSELNNAGLVGVDASSLSIGEELGDSPELHLLINTFCYKVLLTVLNTSSVDNDFGNHDEGQNLGEVDEREDGNVLGDTDGGQVLAETGSYLITPITIGWLTALASLGLATTTRKKESF